MPRILAIEPDPSQAATLKWLVKERVGAELVLADSKETAIAAIAAEVPDIIIAGALMSPREEADLSDHLRTLDAEHLQILTIPLLATREAADEEPGRLRLNPFRRRRAKAAPNGCDPLRYGDELKGYVKLALEARAERLARLERERRARKLDGLEAAEIPAAAGPEADFDLPMVDTAPAALYIDYEPAPAEAAADPYEEPAGSASVDTASPESASPESTSVEQIATVEVEEPALEPLMAAAEEAAAEEVAAEEAPADATAYPIVESAPASVEEPAAETAIDEPEPDRPTEFVAAAVWATAAAEPEPADECLRVEAVPVEVSIAVEAPAAEHVEPIPAEAVPADAIAAAPAAVEDEIPDEIAPAPNVAASAEESVEASGDAASVEEFFAADSFDAAPAEAAVAAPAEESWSAEPAVPALEPAVLAFEPLQTQDTFDERYTDAVEPAVEPAAATPVPADEPPAFDRLLSVLPPSLRHDEEPVAFLEEDRIALSATSLDRDRQEATNWLWADDAVYEPPKPAAAAVPAPARPEDLHWVQSEATQPWHPLAADGSGGLASGPEIWQALPDWVDGWPPLASWISVSRPAKTAAPAHAAESDPAAKEAAPAKVEAPPPAVPEKPEAPVVDSRWIASALDALRSDIQMLRAATSHADTQQPVPGTPAPASATPKKKPRQPRPLQDEWGMFDPSQAGMEALLAALEAQESDENVPEEEVTAADLLLRESAPEPWAMPDLQAELAAAQPVAPPAPRPRLAPLSMWARADREPHAAATAGRDERDDLRELLAGLGVPAHVAAVSYPRGCRIRRVRMTRDAKTRRRTGRRADPVIILPQKARAAGEARKKREPASAARD